MIVKRIMLNLCEGMEPPPIRISQFDTMWQLVFSILYKDRAWVIPDGATVALLGRKSDGTEFSIDGIIEDNKAVVDCNEDLSNVIGFTVCALSFVVDEKRVTTVNFAVFVEPAPVVPGTSSLE